MYINNQLQTVVGQKAMVELRSRVMGPEVKSQLFIQLAFNRFQVSRKTSYRF